ncbi:MAG: hypothetical protein NXH90_09575 [Flavobacteriaceae bacterium]|nr:hypothetical protein [Flavobacteriaceae bacterium]
MENLQNYYVIGGALNTLGQLIIVIASIILLIKQRNIPVFLILLGSTLSILFSVGSVFWNMVSAQDGPESLARNAGIVNIVSQLPYLLFAIGLLLYIIMFVKKQIKKE